VDVNEMGTLSAEAKHCFSGDVKPAPGTRLEPTTRKEKLLDVIV
jgi:hypothetical protein